MYHYQSEFLEALHSTNSRRCLKYLPNKTSHLLGVGEERTQYLLNKMQYPLWCYSCLNITRSSDLHVWKSERFFSKSSATICWTEVKYGRQSFPVRLPTLSAVPEASIIMWLWHPFYQEMGFIFPPLKSQRDCVTLVKVMPKVFQG